MTRISNPNTYIFSPVRFVQDKKKSTLVAEKIVQAINDRKLQHGEKLPSEREIAEQMNVSRTVVREALSALRIGGVVSVHIGDGTYVAETVSEKKTLREVPIALEQYESPLEIWEARKALESAVGALAINKASKKNLQFLEGVFHEMAARVEATDYEGYLSANRKFHWALLRFADNPILYRIAAALLDMTDQLLTKEPTRQYLAVDLPQSLEKHKKILEAFKTADSAGLTEAVNHHFDELRKFYLEDYD